MKSTFKTIILSMGLLFVLFLSGCSSREVPQAHKGRMFEKTGSALLYMGKVGFSGSILEPGTYYTGWYNEIKLLDCAVKTQKEPLKAQTKDGVQYDLDIYVRYGANCAEAKVVESILSTLSPVPAGEVPKGMDEHYASSTITAEQLYVTFIRPALGEAARESVSPYIANDINEKREVIFGEIKKRFEGILAKQQPRMVIIADTNLSNMDYPQDMKNANVERAVQATLSQKAIAERQRVTEEITTANMRKQLAESQASNEAARIEKVGAALDRYPGFLQYQLQEAMPGIYEKAGEKGNMVITAPSPTLMLPAKK